ncbi:cadmium ion transporter [Rhizoctonia solani AG-1 IA]|uniref:Cadmium ion transporter n=1 Tax=Thanatephorus cucumeris (strain AG1-IA) TaxID=983506 RepID=L8WXB0_THACA|nr:cadmium ion transporter [Rhizoctonia solani AG-1 IA]
MNDRSIKAVREDNGDSTKRLYVCLCGGATRQKPPYPIFKVNGPFALIAVATEHSDRRDVFEIQIDPIGCLFPGPFLLANISRHLFLLADMARRSRCAPNCDTNSITGSYHHAGSSTCTHLRLLLMAKNLFQKLWHPDPASPNFAEGKTVPDVDANVFSQFTFWWLTPLLRVGWSRPLQSEDLWDLNTQKQASVCGDRIERLFYERCPPRKRPSYMRPFANNIVPEAEREDLEKAEASSCEAATMGEKRPQIEAPWIPLFNHINKWDQSLLRALNRAFFWRFWTAGLFKGVADVLNATTPVVTRLLLTYLSEAYYHSRGTPGAPQPRSASYGFALAIAVAAMQEGQRIVIQIFLQGYDNRILVTCFSAKHSTGQITTMISTDCSRLDTAAAFFHIIWTGPIELIIGLVDSLSVAKLIYNLGYSALVGLGVLIVGFPVGGSSKQFSFKEWFKPGMQLFSLPTSESDSFKKFSKAFGSWNPQTGVGSHSEGVLIKRITDGLLTSGIRFITYALTAIIFSSLQLFNIVAGTCGDAYVALGRIAKFLTSEELEDQFEVRLENDYAVDIRGTFTWERGGTPQGSTQEEDKDKDATLKSAATETSKPTKEQLAKKKAGDKEKKRLEQEKKKREKERLAKKKRGIDPNDSSDEEEDGSEPFRLVDVNLQVPRGAFVGIVGRIGSGKSSLLQAITGEMRRVVGNVVLGGTTAYAPQQAWIQNMTLRQNVTFGRPDIPNQFNQVVDACALMPDIEMLHDREQTEIGERGVNLSGGQKARINLARVAYFGPDIALLDDPLSAVDSHVSKHILENCLLSGPLADKTRILVTHQLHVLPYVDEVIFMDNGCIVERGKYSDLVSAGGQFSRLVAEYGVAKQTENPKENEDTNATMTPKGEKTREADSFPVKLMQDEERVTGAVSWSAYASYIRAAGGLHWMPFLALLLSLAQATSVLSMLFLGFWTSNHWNLSQGAYVGIYAGLGFATAIFSFMGSFAFAWAGFIASLNLFSGALSGVLGSPIKFFDTTPIGAIITRLSNDIDTLDANLPQAWFHVCFRPGHAIWSTNLLHHSYYPIRLMLYRYFSIYYRRTSIEVKRLDSILRSRLYAAFSEALTGISTIRAYREQPRFVGTSERKIDMGNKAYFMTITCQAGFLGKPTCFRHRSNWRWIQDERRPIQAWNCNDLRLDYCKLAFIIFAVRMLNQNLQTQTFSQMVTQLAQVEQDMNMVERIVHYRNLEQEPTTQLPNDPPREWEGLPLVLNGLTFNIKPGERVGIVGRTGADGVNIEEIGIETLRHRFSVIPQDTVLFEANGIFKGTLRENIDPFETRTDQQLYSALRRVKLLEPGSKAPPRNSKFHLDNQVRDDLFSAGERQLLATSSVDVDTDRTVQQMIQRHFHGKTLLCIAHRRRLKEYDTPLDLFDNPESHFRAMCDKAGLSRADIVKIREDAKAQL